MRRSQINVPVSRKKMYDFFPWRSVYIVYIIVNYILLDTTKVIVLQYYSNFSSWTRWMHGSKIDNVKHTVQEARV